MSVSKRELCMETASLFSTSRGSDREFDSISHLVLKAVCVVTVGSHEKHSGMPVYDLASPASFTYEIANSRHAVGISNSSC